MAPQGGQTKALAKTSKGARQREVTKTPDGRNFFGPQNV